MGRWLAVVIAVLFWALAGADGVRAEAPDVAIPNGRFYPQAGDGQRLGFAITDDGGLRFWRDYQRLGGVATLGYPASFRFVGADGFVYQVVQGGLLQWRPETGQAVLANTFEILQQAGQDDWLYTVKGIPRPVADDGSGGDFARAVIVRLSWLTEERLRDYYLRNPNPAVFPTWGLREAMDLYGLPMSRPERFGPFISQRFQRVSLQLWVEEVPGMPAPGTVVRILGGDLLKEAGLVPRESTEPLPVDSPLLRIDPPLRPAALLLAGQPATRPLLDPLLARRVPIVFAPLPDAVVGLFSARPPTIRVSTVYRGADAPALAAVIVHEAAHASDFFRGEPIDTPEGCFATEERAFRYQAEFWRLLFGPQGRQPPTSDLDRVLNRVLQAVQSDSEGFSARIRRLYAHECRPAQVLPVRGGE